MTAKATAITGRGVVSSLGLDVAGFTSALFAGECAIDDISDLAPAIRIKYGAPLRNFAALDHFDERTLAYLDRFTQFAAVAARQAWRESGFSDAPPALDRVGVVIGTGVSGIDILDEGFRRFLSGQGRPRPLTVPMTMGSAPASRIAREFGIRGPTFGVTSACASAAHAIIIGNALIRSGLIDVAVVGGTDSCFCDGFLRAWDVLRVVSPDTCRPFSADRRGLIMGEGSAVMVLERAEHAAARGRAPLARFLGGGMTSDAGDLLTPDSTGMTEAMRLALADAGIDADAVDYINAHGTGTVANDRTEAQAINTLFGGRSTPIPVSSTKSMIGHAMGASGAIEAIATIAALRDGLLPPTVNFLRPDPECAVDAVPNVARPADIAVALSNSFAFGGLNVSLAFGRADA
ncbi:MAG: beta-ketoacyl-[acyl-carrier-protein] synthase family protein [Hyphomicrobiaceae bacterium]|nr:beta-ketoacyl-[acyl-carrier-protein] synthase family protein [Hyphomicrobiaceae bacterium]